MAPSRFQYANNARNAFLTYNGHPMIAKSPWARLAAGPTSSDADPNKNAIEALFSHENPYSRTGVLLERLVYGVEYELAVGYMGTAGNLAAPLVDTTAAIPFPATFSLPGPDVVLPSVKVTCKRRGPIGEFRTNGPAFPPPIPAGVVPRYRTSDAVGDGSYQPEHHPLILLLPPPAGGVDPWIRSNPSFPSSLTQFLLSPPTVDIKVWDRWQPTTGDLAQVLADHYNRLSQQHLGFQLDLSPYPNEPAVTGFTVSVSRVDGAAGPLDPLAVAFATSTAAAGLGKFQKPGVPVTIQSVAVAKKPDGDATGVNIYIPAGQIWRVDFTPVLTAQDRFETAPDPAKAAYSMIVEVARPLFSTDAERLSRCQDLFNSLAAGAADAGDGFAFTIASKDMQVNYQKDFYRTEVSLQQWLWDGRPLYELDALGQLNPPLHSVRPHWHLDSTFSGDGMLFSARYDSDSAIHGAFVDYVDPTNLKNEVFRRNLSSWQGAQYFRFSLRTYSRYAPLLASSTFSTRRCSKTN